MDDNKKEVVSTGHLLGQIIGDWWEKYIVMPMLEDVAQKLNLFSDCRHVNRLCRGEKVQWNDAEGNIVDYDFVLELNGNSSVKGIPVAFMESFWRRGARHSKDKARDDTNKLLPMRRTYPSARFLAISACGEFTEPARDYVRSRDVQLFFVPKHQIVKAFSKFGLEVDYPDKETETKKKEIAQKVQRKLNEQYCQSIACCLRENVGIAAFHSFSYQIIAALSALPQEIRIKEARLSEPILFKNTEEVSNFLQAPKFTHLSVPSSYTYEITYSDGTEFKRDVDSLIDLKILHTQVQSLVDHMSRIGIKSA